jgi:aspartate dehydrogenase
MPLSVAIDGFGAIGKVLAKYLDRGIEGLVLSAVSARDKVRAETAMAGFTSPVPVLSLSERGACADITNIMSPGPIMVLPPSQRAVPDATM